MKLFPRWRFLVIYLSLAVVAFAQQPAIAPACSRFELPATDDGLPGAGPIRRFDWFRKLWADRRALWSQRAEQDRHALVFLGDSITQGWGDDIGGSFHGVKVANRGISGDTTRGVLIRIDDVLALDPSGVIILIGTNDLEDGADPETVARNLKLIIARLEAHDPKMPIILCQVFPSSASKKRPAATIKELNRLYAAAVKGDAHVTLLETWPLFANADDDAKPEEFPDLLHPNKASYAKWAAAIYPILATLDFVDTQPDNFTPEPGFQSLFNGHDLTGWGYLPTLADEVKTARDWHERDPQGAAAWPIVTQTVRFDGMESSPDGRYVAKHGRLIVTTPPEFRKVQKISTMREFPRDFILRLEFRATPDTDSGIFIREPQLQCRDYLIAGPYKDLQHYKPQEWNEIEITVRGQKALCTCNGEVMESSFAVPATGPIGLEGDRGQMEYRRIRIKELTD